MKSIYDYAHTSQVQMEDFRAQYRAKYAELRSALEEFRQHNPSPRQFSHPVSNHYLARYDVDFTLCKCQYVW